MADTWPPWMPLLAKTWVPLPVKTRLTWAAVMSPAWAVKLPLRPNDTWPVATMEPVLVKDAT